MWCEGAHQELEPPQNVFQFHGLSDSGASLLRCLRDAVAEQAEHLHLKEECVWAQGISRCSSQQCGLPLSTVQAGTAGVSAGCHVLVCPGGRSPTCMADIRQTPHTTLNWLCVFNYTYITCSSTDILHTPGLHLWVLTRDSEP